MMFYNFFLFLPSSGNVDLLTWSVSIIAMLLSTWEEPWPTKRKPALHLRQVEHNADVMTKCISLCKLQNNKLAPTDALWVANVSQKNVLHQFSEMINCVYIYIYIPIVIMCHSL